MRHSLNKLIMQAWSKTKLNMDLWKWHMNLIKARASKWAELNHRTESCTCFDFTAETSKASTLWGLPDSTVPPPPTDYKAASCLFVSNYRKHRCALFGKVQAITSPTVVKSPGAWSGMLRPSLLGWRQKGLTLPKHSRCFHNAPSLSQPPSMHPSCTWAWDTRPLAEPVQCNPDAVLLWTQTNSSKWKLGCVGGGRTWHEVKVWYKDSLLLLRELSCVPTARYRRHKADPAASHAEILYWSEESLVFFVFFL